MTPFRLWLRYFPHLTKGEAKGIAWLLGGSLGPDVAEHVRQNLWHIRLWPKHGATDYIDNWLRRDALLKKNSGPSVPREPSHP